MSEDLKPCPFCGGRAALYELLSPEGKARGEKPCYDINCEDCWVDGRWETADPQEGPAWRPIESAPRDCSHVLILTRGRWAFEAYFGESVEGEDGECWTWAAVHEGIHPPCWSGGLRWSVNEDGEPSDPPIGWMPLPAPPSSAMQAEGDKSRDDQTPPLTAAERGGR